VPLKASLAPRADLGGRPEREGGGKVRLGPISERGNGYLRRLLVNGAMAALDSRRARQNAWLGRLLATKARKVVVCALANKMARIAWAVMIAPGGLPARVGSGLSGQDRPHRSACVGDGA
jgi:transposase